MSVSKTRLYRIWQDMKNRCNNPGVKCYPRYGGRGIKVCPEWEANFLAFEEWAYSNGYREYLTIDRIDNGKGYSPDNCRWATEKGQARNRRNTIKIKINEEERPLQEWAEIAGISGATIFKRYEQGDRGSDLIRPFRQHIRRCPRRIEINGQLKTISELSEETGIGKSTIRYRWKTGKRGVDLIQPPIAGAKNRPGTLEKPSAPPPTKARHREP